MASEYNNLHEQHVALRAQLTARDARIETLEQTMVNILTPDATAEQMIATLTAQLAARDETIEGLRDDVIRLDHCNIEGLAYRDQLREQLAERLQP